MLEQILAGIEIPQNVKVTRVEGRSLFHTINKTRAEGKVPVIAEIKFRSPRGEIRKPESPAKIARLMEEGGATGISVLTERRYFGGDPSFIPEVKKAVGLPVLRKDFIVHPNQVYESAELGADSILLIVSVLGRKTKEFMELASELGMESLVEVCNEEELCIALEAGAKLIGINNRNLRTLEVDLSMTEKLAPFIPPGVVVVSESGISTPEDVRRMLRAGADAVLIGTSIMKEEDVKGAVERFVWLR